MKLFAIVITFWSVVLSSSSVDAATYYVATTGNNSNPGTSAQPWLTISYGCSAIAGGDTLYIKDGVYTGAANRISNVPSGSSGNYTKIYAENDWKVTISNPTNFPAYLNNNSYVEVRGIKFKNYAGVKVYVNNSNHIKIIRCSSDDNGGTAAGFLTSNSRYVLFEECYKYGASRYPFQVNAGSGSSSYIIFRRCVVRWDYSNTNVPQACFANYGQSYVYFQNCLAIDGLDIRGQEVVYDGLKGFFVPNGANQTHFQGCLALNLEGAGFWMEKSPVTNVTLTNSVVWDCKNHANAGTDGYPPRTFYSEGGIGSLSLSHCVFGQSNWTSRVVDSDLGTGDTLKNSIIANFGAMTDYAEDGFDTSVYNDYYGNNGGRNRTGGLGAHSLTINPFTNSLKYLTRIESGSDLAGKADDGGKIGATILKKIGVSGTLYGEAGWDAVTADNLWPFPNEDVMRLDMKAWSKVAGAAYAGSPAMSGDRGFCAGQTTLTKYIWEYLGNTIPVEIYGAAQNTPAVLATIGSKTAAFAVSPTLYFSDLIDGPKTGWNGSATKGAAVTIWGKNFGYTRGSLNYVTVGGVNLTADSDYAEWGVTTNNARGMERITFWLKNNCVDGAGTISVTVDGVTSN
ncbi:MAG: right-handed parallel beta-helix repeat-containing protein, partial [Candidatus Omnitrophota bacterium]|nr:right-handed parallel beta-helix repeat-containing protein [Candidatus Omnitrophota bacterium]